MSRASITYTAPLGTFTSSAAGAWIPLPQPLTVFGVVLDVSSSLAGGNLQGTISTSSTEVVTLATSTGPHAFSTGGTPVSFVRWQTTGGTTVTLSPVFSASL